MKLADYLADKKNEHSTDGNPSVKCNSLGKTPKSFNCQLTPEQAIDLARFLLDKAQLIRRCKIDDAAVHLWNVGEDSETVSVGLIQERKGPRRKKAKVASSSAKKPG